jgi:hypothetical protein
MRLDLAGMTRSLVPLTTMTLNPASIFGAGGWLEGLGRCGQAGGARIYLPASKGVTRGSDATS